MVAFIFTSRNSSCRKVMFSQACVIPSVHRLGVYPSMQLRQGVCPGGCLPEGVSARRDGVYPGWGVCLEGVYHTQTPSNRPPTPTEALGTHPTGMHSCFVGSHETTRQKCNAEELRVAHNNVCA